jgi:hypothetical protein
VNEKIRLLCMRADSEVAAIGSVFDRTCSLCAVRVMIAPSGQAFLASHPEAKIICNICYQPDKSDDHRLTAPLKDVLNEARNAGPNPYRRRN